MTHPKLDAPHDDSGSSPLEPPPVNPAPGDATDRTDPGRSQGWHEALPMRGVPGLVARANRRVVELIALAAGALQVLAYAPFELPIFAVLGPMVLLLLLRAASGGRGACLGLLYGLGLFGAGVYWIYYSLHLFGDAIAPLAALLTGGFVLGMALYPAALGYFLCRWAITAPLWMLAVAPAGWVLAEWLRSWVLTGFPWLLLGHSQTDWPLAGYLPLFGVFGVSWILALTAGAAALLCCGRTSMRPALWGLGAIAGVWLGGAGLKHVPWSAPEGEPMQVRAVQGNVEQHVKFIAEVLQPSIDLYRRLSLAGPRVDLVIWPETAIPTFYHRVAGQLVPVAEQLRETGTDLAIGVLDYRRAERRYFNAVRKVVPRGEPEQVYLKHHLVPFGEFMPFRELLEFIARFILIPMSDLDAGPEQQAPLSLAGRLAGVSICYEDAFGEEVIKQLPAAHFLLNVSNDAWFGDSIAPHQHLQIARVRALETARPMVRATNTGISAFIDYDGRILARSPQFKAHALDASIQPRTGATAYVRFGNLPVVVALFLVLGVAGAALSIRNRT